MKKISILLAILVAAIVPAKAQDYVVPEETWKFAEVSGSNYHGYAFHKDWSVDIEVENQDGRYTPDDADIVKAEKLIQKKIAYLNRFHENQEGKVPLIDEHMTKYERQYVGFTDIHGFHILWVNFVWDESAKSKLSKDILYTEGGGPYYWSVKVNLDTEKVYGLVVNDQNASVKYLPRVKRPGPRISKPKNQYNPQRIRKTGIIHSEAEKRF